MMKSKGYKAGGKMKTKGYKAGGKLNMVEKDGKKVPFFAADGKGKMASGGMVPKTKGYFKGGKTMMAEKTGAAGKTRGTGAATKGTRHSGKMG